MTLQPGRQTDSRTSNDQFAIYYFFRDKKRLLIASCTDLGELRPSDSLLYYDKQTIKRITLHCIRQRVHSAFYPPWEGKMFFRIK